MNLADAKPEEERFEWEDLSNGLDDVPPRPIIIEGVLQRGVVTFVSGRGAAAKSAFAQQVALMVANGTAWAYWEPRSAGRVVLVNGEDDLDEQRRRMSAAKDIQGAPLADRIHTLNAARITMFEPDPETGLATPTKLWEEVKRKVRKVKADVLIIDPLVESHCRNENDNGHMAHVVGHMKVLARNHQCAVLVVHHMRKGAVGGDQDGARGASALVNAARTAITMEKMTEEDAVKLLPEKEVPNHARYIRVSDPKQNYGPSLGDRWLMIKPVLHKNGESYPALVEPRMRVKPSDEAILSALAESELRWVEKRNGPKEGRADHVLGERFEIAPKEAHEIVRRLLKSGLAHTQPRRDAKGHERHVVVVGRPPELPLGDGDEPEENAG